jgi:hypothetical protein
MVMEEWQLLVVLRSIMMECQRDACALRLVALLLLPVNRKQYFYFPL